MSGFPGSTALALWQLERYAPEPNPYADFPQTFACQQIEAVNAWRALVVALLTEVARALRRLPFCDY